MEKMVNSLDKRQFFVFVLSLVIITLITFSYAFFYSTDVIEQNVASTHCFKISFEDENDINLNKSYPLSELEGSKLIPYTFTIKNVCNYLGKYEINIESINDSTLSTNYVRYKLNDMSSKILGNQDEKVEYVNNNVAESRNIDVDFLKPNEEKTYSLRLWIDEDSTIEQSADKLFNSKVVVKMIDSEDSYHYIRLNTNGGTISSDTIVGIKSTPIGNVEEPTRLGYDFDGWYFDSEFNQSFDKNTIVTEELTDLYAKWVPHEYEITYDYNYLSSDSFKDYYIMNIENDWSDGTVVDSGVVLEDNYLTYYQESSGNPGFYFKENASNKLVTGHIYTFQAEIKADHDDSLIIGSERGGQSSYDVTTSWKRINYTFVARDSTKGDFTIYYGSNGNIVNGNNKISIRNIQMQETNSLNITTVTQNYGTIYNMNVPTKSGYTFNGWYTDPIDGDKMEPTDMIYYSLDKKNKLYAHWSPNSNTTYKVEHYQMDTSGNYSNTPFEVDNLTGVSENKVTPSVRTYEGFESPEAQDVFIKADGSTVIKYYYERIKYLQKTLARYQNTAGAYGDYSELSDSVKYVYYGASYSYSKAATAEYSAVSVPAYTVTGEKTNNQVTFNRNKYTQTTQGRYMNTSGAYGNYSNLETKDVYYGASYSYSKAATAEYAAVSVAAYTVTAAKTNQVSFARRQYTQTTQGRYMNTSGTYGNYSNLESKNVYYGASYSYSKAATAEYAAASVAAYTVTAAKTNQISFARNKYSLVVKPNGGTWSGSTANQTFTQYYGTTKALANPSASYAVAYNANGQGASYTASPTAASRPFSSWTKTGSTWSGNTFTFKGAGTATANYNGTASAIALPAISKSNAFCYWRQGSTSGTVRSGGQSLSLTGATTFYAKCNAASIVNAAGTQYWSRNCALCDEYSDYVRRIYKKYSGVAYAAQCYTSSGPWYGPVLVSTVANNVAYYTSWTNKNSPSMVLTYAGTISYGGATWYYSQNEHWVADGWSNGYGSGYTKYTTSASVNGQAAAKACATSLLAALYK